LIREREETIKTMKRVVDEGRRAKLWAQSAMVVDPKPQTLILKPKLGFGAETYHDF
jgi:hypothetical protein